MHCVKNSLNSERGNTFGGIDTGLTDGNVGHELHATRFPSRIRMYLSRPLDRVSREGTFIDTADLRWNIWLRSS